MNRKVRSAIIRILFISGLSLIPLLVSCGKSIENAQDFIPNDPPVIESCTVTDNATGKEVDASNIILGMTLKCAVKAVDPEGKPLTYTFTSDYLSCSSQTSTADGCDGLFVVTRVVANTPVTLTVAVRDQKEASATKLIPIGTGKEGPLLTLGSPVKAAVNNAGSTTFSFNCSSDGWYQVLESSDDVAKDPSAHMSTSAKYTAGTAKTATVGGPSYSGAIDTNTVKVSSGDGVKKIWIIFKDNNNYYTASSVSVSLDNAGPSITSTTPANNATNVSTAPTISVVFSEAMDSSSLSDVQLTPTGGTVSQPVYNTMAHTVSYVVTGLSKNTPYNVTISNAKDVAGNIVSGSFSFTTTVSNNVVTFDRNGADGGSVPGSKNYNYGSTVDIPGAGTLYKNECGLIGWAQNRDGSGTVYKAGSTSLVMGASDINLYAVWGHVPVISTMTIAGNLSLSVDIMGTSAKGGGTLTDKGCDDVTEWGICWTTTGNPTISGNHVVSSTVIGVGSSFNDALMTGLTPNTDYHVRAYAKNSGGIGYGSEVVFNSGYSIGTSIDISYGLVFYNDGHGHGLMSASGVVTKPDWSILQVPWGPASVDGTRTAIGTGKSNTEAIINKDSTGPNAAVACNAWKLNGMDGWLLPSIDELNLLFQRLRGRAGITFVSNTWYWSSSESDPSNAWVYKWIGSDPTREVRIKNSGSTVIMPVKEF